MIYAENAPKYHAVGLPAIPIMKGEKRPAINGWNRFCSEMPSELEMDAWKRRYPDGNIGLPLGKASGLVAVDIDSEEPWIIEGITKLLPPTMWTRVGKKGLVLMYRFNGEKSFQIKDSSDGVIVEILSHNKQVVLPPSIHPDTKLPYTADNNLYEVLDQLPYLPAEIEQILRGFLKEQGVELSSSGHTKMIEWVPAGSRDVSMINMAGLLAGGVVRGEHTLLEAIGTLKAWAANYTEKVAGDEMDIDKGLSKIVEFLSRDVRGKQRVLPTGWDNGLTEDDKKNMGVDFDKDMEEWTVDEVRDYLKTQFENIPRASQSQRTPVVEKVLTKIAFSPSMSDIDAEQLYQYIRDTSGMNLTVSTLRKRVRDIARGDEIEGLNHEEIASEVLKDIQEIYTLRYVNDQFYRWEGSRWEKLPDSELLRRISENYGHLPAARKANDHAGIVRVMASKVAGDLKEIEDFEGVNFANGVLTRDLKLVAHKPQYGFTYTLPFRYIPDEAKNCDKWLAFLEDCWAKDDDYEEKVAALQEAICVTMFGTAYTYQRCFLCYGLPRTGKSVLLNIIQNLVPDEGRCAVPPKDWSDKFAPTQMFGKVLNMCGELSENKWIEGDSFKQITEGAMISGQYKGKQIFEFQPKCAHWFGSNHLPKSKDHSQGFIRRWQAFEFTHVVPKEKINRELANDIIREEREAIVAWAMQAMPRIRNAGDFTQPSSQVRITESIAEANNSVRFFIRNSGKVMIDPDLSNTEKNVPHKELYSAYSVFCGQAMDVKRVGPAVFREMMKELAELLKFQIVFEKNAMGFSEIKYIGLTLVD